MTNSIRKPSGQGYNLQPPLGMYFRMKSWMRSITKVESS